MEQIFQERERRWEFLERKNLGLNLVFFAILCFYPPTASQFVHAQRSTPRPEIRFAVVIFYLTVPEPALGLLGSTARNTGHGEAVGAGRGDGEVRGYTLTRCPWSPQALGMGQPSAARAERGTHQGWAGLCGISHIPSPTPYQGAQRLAPLDAAPSPSQHLGHWELAEPAATSQFQCPCWGSGWH